MAAAAGSGGRHPALLQRVVEAGLAAGRSAQAEFRLRRLRAAELLADAPSNPAKSPDIIRPRFAIRYFPLARCSFARAGISAKSGALAESDGQRRHRKATVNQRNILPICVAGGSRYGESGRAFGPLVTARRHLGKECRLFGGSGLRSGLAPRSGCLLALRIAPPGQVRPQGRSEIRRHLQPARGRTRRAGAQGRRRLPRRQTLCGGRPHLRSRRRSRATRPKASRPGTAAISTAG